MVRLPAFCSNCGAVFPSAYAVEDSKHLELKGCVSQCPSCGIMGRVPDGVYDFVEDAITLLSGPESTKEELARFAEIVERARRENLSPEAFGVEVRRDAPAYVAIADQLASSERRQSHRDYLMILLAAIMAIQECPADQLPATPEQVIEQVCQLPASDSPSSENTHAGEEAAHLSSAPLPPSGGDSESSPKPHPFEGTFRRCQSCGGLEKDSVHIRK